MRNTRLAGEQFFVEAENAVEKYGTDMKLVLADMKQTLGVSGKKLFMPLRIALTGRTDGPELASIAEILGQKKMQHRLSQAFKRFHRDIIQLRLIALLFWSEWLGYALRANPIYILLFSFMGGRGYPFCL